MEAEIGLVKWLISNSESISIYTLLVLWNIFQAYIIYKKEQRIDTLIKLGKEDYQLLTKSISTLEQVSGYLELRELLNIKKENKEWKIE